MRRLFACLAAGAVGLLSSPARADQVIVDELIVQGAVCVGFDCVNDEVFPSPDSIELKENNTRVKFEDTTDPLVGPSTDWQLTANDTASGGASYLSVDDVTSSTTPFRVDGAAPTDTLVLTSVGALGVGTGAPVAESRLHVVGDVRIAGDLLLPARGTTGSVLPSALVKRTGSVVFPAPMPVGTYAVALSAVGTSANAKLEVSLVARDENGFTFSVSGNLANLAEVIWMVRAVGES